MKVVFTGGGSAGHVLPAVPVMRALRARGAELAYIGRANGAEADYLDGEDWGYHGIASGKLRRYFSWRNATDAFSVLRGLWQSHRLLGRLRPDVIFSKGGFVSFPVVLAGWLRRIPVIAHESDVSPGLANRLAMPFLSVLATSFPIARPRMLRGGLIHCGSPVRPELLSGDPARGRERAGASAGVPLVLVTGGSLGAESLNALVRQAAPQLVKHCHLAHVCGPGKAVPLGLPGYRAFEFVAEGWGDLLAAADAVVSRAGANAVFELLALGKPNLLVPLPKTASRGDQIENADYAERAGYSLVIPEEDLNAPRLAEAVQGLLAERDQWTDRLAGFQALPTVDILADAIARLGGLSVPTRE
ncbi:MAG: UDP-N-acetylglucosamine--N-acetylmuramyl-(pentapeptide) pyrophosphoryl-undecaprenol N-acetylglucosamine transferase [Gammaproteobacteria bacterium]|nr:UDP-N-acetylglucosamine--N-acetylmuramyl-(pentapeptide) pyrophosphoryl-undecaprenol N-acetylglucosamine transferase [Gammaproteobacteria bacterium]